jgi:hypothetical protein
MAALVLSGLYPRRAAMRKRIAGILCEVEPDEDGFGFVNVFIAEGQKLLPEFIVRGALTLPSALIIAEWCIKERLAGRTLIHHVEGWIHSIPIDPGQFETGELDLGDGGQP